MNQIKNNKNKILSYLGAELEGKTGLEGIQNSILLGKNNGVSITGNNYKKNVNKIILQKKELNTENTLKVDSKSLQNKLIDLNIKNNNLNLFLTNSFSEISATKQKQIMSELKSKINLIINGLGLL